MLAWVFDSGAENNHSQQLSPEECARRMAAKGYNWAALEYDDPRFRPEVWYPQFHYWCLVFGVRPGVWFTTGGDIYKTPADAHFTIAEVEGPGDLEGVTNVINGVGGGPLPPMSKAIVTNFSTMTRENVKPLIQAGFTCLTEAYMNESLGQNPDAMDSNARYLGWPTSQPVFGVYPTASQPNPVPLYDPWQSWPGVDYLGENVL
jgi:hypothetical protein